MRDSGEREECDSRDDGHSGAAARRRSTRERRTIEVIPDIAELHRSSRQRSSRSTCPFLANDGTMSFRVSEILRLLGVRKYTDESDHGVERFTGERSRDHTRRVTSSTDQLEASLCPRLLTSVGFVFIFARFHYFIAF